MEWKAGMTPKEQYDYNKALRDRERQERAAQEETARKDIAAIKADSFSKFVMDRSFEVMKEVLPYVNLDEPKTIEEFWEQADGSPVQSLESMQVVLAIAKIGVEWTEFGV